MIQHFKNINKENTPIFLEITAFAAVATVIAVILAGTNKTGVHFSPDIPLVFLFLITLVVVRYGTNWSLYTAAVAAIVGLIIQISAKEPINALFPVIGVYLLPPLLFGPVHTKFSKKITNLEKKLNNTKREYENTTRELAELTGLKDTYEKRLLVQSAKLSEFYEDALTMQELEVDALGERIIHMVHRYLETEACSLYSLEKNNLILKNYIGQYNEQNPPYIISIEQEPFKTVFNTRKTYRINEENSEPANTENIPLYIGPLITPTGKIIGVITIDAIPMLKHNRLTEKTFNLLCAWAAKAIENAAHFQNHKSDRIINPETGIYSFPYLKSRLDETMADSAVSNQNFAVILINIRQWSEVPDKNRTPLVKFVSRLVRQNIRDFDILAHFREENEFAVLMPRITAAKLEEIIDSLELNLGRYSLFPYYDGSTLKLSIRGICNLKKMKSTDDLIARLRNIAASPQLDKCFLNKTCSPDPS